MKKDYTKMYTHLISSFLKGEIDARIFEQDYLSLFRKTADDLDAAIYDIIEPLFYGVTDFTQDTELLKSPDMYLDEKELKSIAAKTLNYLLALK